jgi:hypothetical protein
LAKIQKKEPVATMKKFLALAALAAVSAAPSFADTLATWTFETAPITGTYTPGAGTATTNFLADSGLQAGSAFAIGLHAVAATAYSSPAGNGSTHSFSVNNWSVNDYWQFQLSTTGEHGLSVSYDQTSSTTGPRDFQLSYSVNGGSSFTLVGSTYTVLPNSAPNAWNSTTAFSIFNFNYDLGSAIDDTGTVIFRITDVSTVSANGGTVATAGTDRLDNFTVFTTPVPEPSTVALGIVGGLAGLVIWKRRK